MEDNDDVDIVDGGVDDIACNELSTAWGPGLLAGLGGWATTTRCGLN